MLTVSIPDDIEKQLSSMSDNKEEFIISAIKQVISLQLRPISSNQLAKEYSDSVKENIEIEEDFSHADNEVWNER